jgi:ubiquinone/menaquinone biosynthesis C-methylase UbiE
MSETYTHTDSTVATDHMSRRAAASHAAFFLPYLRSGMSLLDCGCGVGTITISLAEIWGRARSSCGH